MMKNKHEIPKYHCCGNIKYYYGKMHNVNNKEIAGHIRNVTEMKCESKINLNKVNKMKKSPKLLYRSLFILLAVMLSFFVVWSFTDSPLYAGSKKSKIEKKKKIAEKKKLIKKYENLRTDYHYTIENFIVLLRKLVNLCTELEERVAELEAKSASQNQDLERVREFCSQLSIDESTFRLGISTPFYEDPIFFDNIRIERHILGGDSSVQTNVK